MARQGGKRRSVCDKENKRRTTNTEEKQKNQTRKEKYQQEENTNRQTGHGKIHAKVTQPKKDKQVTHRTDTQEIKKRDKNSLTLVRYLGKITT